MSKRVTFIASLGLAIALVAVGTAAAMTRSGAGTAAPTSAKAGSLTGAGSSFVAPLVSQWIPAMSSAYGIKITYGPIGSGGGISAITGGTVDFGASDAPMTPSQFQACKGCIQIPWALGGTSFPYNVPGVKSRIRLTGQVLSKIFSGDIKNWNDGAIKSTNPGVSLPDLAITPIHRSDNSGTTYNVTEYFSNVDPSWKAKFGKGVAVNWAGGTAARGSAGVAGALSHTPGGITYVDVAYSLVNKFTFASVKNKAGKWTTPGIRSCAAAASTIKRVAPKNNGISIVNPGKNYKIAYPVCTFTYVIVPESTSKAKDLRTFIHWALTKGQAFGPKLLFVPIPPIILKASLKALASVK